MACRRTALLAPILTAAILWAHPALAGAQSGLVVTPHPISQPGLSYFKLSAKPASRLTAGSIALRNTSPRRMRVALSAVDGETLSTLGSSYAPPGRRPDGSALWLYPRTRTVSLPPAARLAVPVTLFVPPEAQPGDYLSGVSIEALDQRQRSVGRRGVSIASVARYAIGIEVSLPGPRHPRIEFTGAKLQREPGGLTFSLLARNPGNVILQGVHGYVRVARGAHTVVSQPIAAGTFVDHTNIAYPVNAFRERPPQGTRYRVTALLRYPGGIARLDTVVTFGHRAAVVQQQYGGAPAPTGGGTAWWKLAGIAAVVLYALLTTVLLLRRRRHDPAQAPR